MKIKYWIGVSDVNGRKPDDFITIEVRDSDQLMDALEMSMTYIENQYNGNWEGYEDEYDEDESDDKDTEGAEGQEDDN